MLSLFVNYSLFWSIYRRPIWFLRNHLITLFYFLRAYQLCQVIILLPGVLFIADYICLKVFFFVVGQLFNLAVYYKLGNKGVYYGRELGVKNLPIVNTFPYNVLPYHPQYIGSLLSMISFMMTFYSPALWNYCFTWCGLISTTMMLE